MISVKPILLIRSQVIGLSEVGLNNFKTFENNDYEFLTFENNYNDYQIFENNNNNFRGQGGFYGRAKNNQ